MATVAAAPLRRAAGVFEELLTKRVEGQTLLHSSCKTLRHNTLAQVDADRRRGEPHRSQLQRQQGSGEFGLKKMADNAYFPMFGSVYRNLKIKATAATPEP
jgi:hypothetical protein